MSAPGRTLQVFPDAGRRQAALRAARSGAPHLRGEDCLTWEDFLLTLSRAHGPLRRPCSPTTARTLLATLAQAAGPSAFRDFIHEPAFARAALEVVLDMKAGRLSPAELQQALEQALPPERQLRARELARLYAAYEERMAGLGLADGEDRLTAARESLQHQAWPPAWEDVESLVLHGVYDVRPSTLELLLALAQACEARGVALRVETPVGGSPVADAALASLFRAFESQGEAFTQVDLFKADVTFESRPLAVLGRRLFDPATPREPVEAPGLRLWSAATAREEVRLMARDIRRLVSAGVPPARIAVAWREPGAEVHHLAEALGELGVPVRLPWGEPLAVAGPVRLALELPLLVEEGFPAVRVAEVVGSRYARALSRAAPEAPATLLALAAVRDDRLGAREGRGAYDIRLEALARRLESRAQEGGRERERRRAHEVRVLRERCLRLFDECRRLPEQGSAAELLAAWWRAVQALGFMDSEPEPARPEEGTLGGLALEARARDEAAREALARWVRELERGLKLAGGGPRMRRRTFGRWLVDSLREVHLPARGAASGAVEVLDIRELEGRTFAHVFLAGLVEGRFPGRSESNPLLSEAERVALNMHLGREVFRLTGGEFEERVAWRLAEDRLLFASALAAAEEGVSLSFAVEGPGGQEQAPSTFLEEVRRLTGLPWEARALPPIAPLDEVLTEPELRQRVALEVLAPPRLRVSEPDPAHGLIRQRFEPEEWFANARELAEVEYERLGFFSNLRRAGRYTGVLVEPEVLEALRSTFRFDEQRPLSASALARFANCGFQGFLQYGLKVAEPEEPGEDFDARGRGTFWHKVVERLFQVLEERGLLGKAPEEMEDLGAVVEEVLEAVGKDFERRHHVGHQRLWELAKARARVMVRRILSGEHRGLPFARLRPERFELPFGPRRSEEGWGAVTLPVAGEVIHLEGTIDRLDSSGGEVGLIDYKSGRLDKKELRERLLQTDFQLPLYLYAARASGRAEARHAAWFSLRTGEVIQLSELLTEEELEGLLATEPEVRARLAQEERPNLPNAVERLVAQVRNGDFSVRPKDCGLCSYRAVCRITERRLVEEQARE